MKKFLLLLTVTLTTISAYANLGDDRADSAQRYGQPASVYGNYANYQTGNWLITEWFNSAGYAVDIAYYKRNGTISQKEITKLQNANVSSASTSWYPITPHGDTTKAVARIWLSNENDYRCEIGKTRLFEDKRWFSYIELSTVAGHLEMVQYNQEHQQHRDDVPRKANNDDEEVPL